ncbi:MAG: outer membrane protein assembly factor BamA [Kiritimatiellae bacterium]|nr:outer membrane protein assembly factor BamA [Kiritimatiellia bacterium]
MRKITVFAFCAAIASAASAVDVTAVNVKILDSFGGDSSQVLSRCQTKPGLAYDPATVSRDVNSLKDSGEYQDISAEAEYKDGGVVVTFGVFRKMRWQGPLAVQGNEALGLSKILDESGLKEGKLYGEAEFAEAAEKVRKAYRKKSHPRATVTPLVKALPGGNDCTLVFSVDEGPEMDVVGWSFDGAVPDRKWYKALDLFGSEDADSKLHESDLREVIGVYPWWDPRCWFGDEPGTAQELASAAEKVAAHYADQGYLDAVVNGPEPITDEDGGVIYVYTVSPGVRYTVGSVSIEGVKSRPVGEIESASDLPKVGDVAGAKALSDAAHSIEVAVGSGVLGLAESRVSVRTIPRDGETDVVDVVFSVTEGIPVVIDQIHVRGNDYTKDKVIRREITFDPGVRMLSDEAEKSKRKLENLDYFSRVRYYLRDNGRGKDETGAAYRELVYEVDEKNTGNFMAGVGAGSVDSIYFYTELQQANFDLFAPGKLFRGAGQKARAFAQAGPRIQTYEVSVTEPWLFDRQLELTVGAYRRQRWYDEYDIIRSGAEVSLAYPVKFWNPARMWNDRADPYVKFGSFGVRFSGEFIEFDDIEHGEWMYKGRTVSLKQEDREYGDAFEGVARLFWSRSTTDSNRRPTTGSRSNIHFDLAGGDNNYWRLGFSHRNYFTTWKRYRHVLMVSMRAETIDAFSDDVPIYNRMFLGGPKSIRGIEYRHVSPFARRYRNEELVNSYTPWGGQTLVCANMEYTVPIVRDWVAIAGFSDIGSVGADEFDFDLGDNFAWTVGLGLRIYIPQFPIRLDFATPVKKPDHADKEVFSFTIGYDF